MQALPEDEEAIVVGGASIYGLFLERCSKIYVTKVEAGFPADRFFPNLDLSDQWLESKTSEMLEENGINFRYIEYVRYN